MDYIDVQSFLIELEEFMKKSGKLKKVSVNIYVGKIQKILNSGYTVADLCGAVDQLIEDYSRGGVKFDSKDHGKTKSALVQVRKMIKGDIISSLYILYKKGMSVFYSKSKIVVQYCIKDEKIEFSLNNSRKKFVRKIGPVDIGKLIYILQEAERQGYLCDQGLICYENRQYCLDSPEPDRYEYKILDNAGTNYHNLFGEGKESPRLALKKQYNSLITKLIYPNVLINNE